MTQPAPLKGRFLRPHSLLNPLKAARPLGRRAARVFSSRNSRPLARTPAAQPFESAPPLSWAARQIRARKVRAAARLTPPESTTSESRAPARSPATARSPIPPPRPARAQSLRRRAPFESAPPLSWAARQIHARKVRAAARLTPPESTTSESRALRAARPRAKGRAPRPF